MRFIFNQSQFVQEQHKCETATSLTSHQMEYHARIFYLFIPHFSFFLTKSSINGKIHKIISDCFPNLVWEAAEWKIILYFIDHFFKKKEPLTPIQGHITLILKK